MLMNIQNTAKRPTSPHPILNLGFRIFFVGSAVFAVVAMLYGLRYYKDLRHLKVR